MTSTPVRAIFLRDTRKEAPFPGGNEVVAVCWNVKPVEKTLKGEDGLTYRATQWMREGDLYIDFLTIRESDPYGEDEVGYEDEDSPVEGGLSPSFAEQLAAELQNAVAYLKSLG